MKIRALLSALLLAAGLMFVTGCESPHRGFREWRAALLKGDLSKANSRTTQQGQMLNQMLISRFKEDADARRDFEKVEIVSYTRNGNTVTLKLKNADGSFGEQEMIKEDGRWKVNVKK